MLNARVIVCTRPDRGVSVIRPSARALRYMTQGGGRFRPSEVPGEVDRWVANGIPGAVARRFVEAMAFGGLTTAEAYEAIRDKDMPRDWTAPELVDDVPLDRWFRNAWTRGHNGGPVEIDLERARAQHRERLRSHVVLRLRQIADALLLADDAGLAAERDHLRHFLATADLGRARSPAELRAIWPRLS